jgi:hypothetical protein
MLVVVELVVVALLKRQAAQVVVELEQQILQLERLAQPIWAVAVVAVVLAEMVVTVVQAS